jgi:20S proteasome subunit beta 2
MAWMWVPFPFPSRHSNPPTPQRSEAVALVATAISAGIFNDLGSGSNVDVCVITQQGTEMMRNYLKPNERYV